MAFVGQKAVKGLAAGIGLISESISSHKAKKESQTNQREENTQLDPTSPASASHDNEHSQEGTAIDSLEEQWELDETQDELRHSPNQEDPPAYDTEEAVDTAIHRFASEYPPPAYSSEAVPMLPAPILLPQRRPKERKRGFIRAYAPDLAAFSIDQKMFLEFLDTAEKACQGARWLNAINLASIGTMFMPSATGIAVSIAIQIATDIAIAVDGTRRTNNFFDKMNREFFQPRGLFCLVMTWNSELMNAPSTTVDLSSMVFKSADTGSDMLSRLRHTFKSSDGKTYGNIFPEVAPLIFPGLDELASDQEAVKKISKTKKKMEFVNNYWDKRAQAQFAVDNPESHLVGPKPTFTSRYADPEHPASSGDLLALVSGGHLSREKLLGMRGGRSPRGRWGSPADSASAGYGRGESRSNPPAPHAAHGRPLDVRGAFAGMRNPRGGRFGQRASSGGEESSENRRMFDRRAERGSGGPLSPIAKLRDQKVLYLAIVNMPSEAEMAHAREAIGQV